MTTKKKAAPKKARPLTTKEAMAGIKPAAKKPTAKELATNKRKARSDKGTSVGHAEPVTAAAWPYPTAASVAAEKAAEVRANFEAVAQSASDSAVAAVANEKAQLPKGRTYEYREAEDVFSNLPLLAVFSLAGERDLIKVGNSTAIRGAYVEAKQYAELNVFNESRSDFRNTGLEKIRVRKDAVVGYLAEEQDIEEHVLDAKSVEADEEEGFVA